MAAALITAACSGGGKLNPIPEGVAASDKKKSQKVQKDEDATVADDTADDDSVEDDEPAEALQRTEAAVIQTDKDPLVDATPPLIPYDESTDEIDISQTGFRCRKDMAKGKGDWAGAYSGTAVKGSVSFTMNDIDQNTLSLAQFGIEGGIFGSDTINSVKIDVTLKCGDTALHDAEADVAGVKVTVKLAFTKQNWNPPSFKGTWKATSSSGNNVASGNWSVQKK